MAQAKAAPTDDLIQPFHLNGREVRGRIIRMGSVAHAVLTRHSLPPAAASLLGRAMALTAMMASAMKFDDDRRRRVMDRPRCWWRTTGMAAICGAISACRSRLTRCVTPARMACWARASWP